MRAIALFVGLAVFACGDDTPAADTAETSAEVVAPDTSAPDVAPDTSAPDVAPDTSAPDVAPDTSPTDVALDTADTGPADVEADTAVDGADTDTSLELPLPGFGTITGPCGFLDDELFDTSPSFFINALDFGADPYDVADFERLTDHGQEIILDGNAGGSSLYSEVFAMEVLARCELATLIASETEILYDVDGKITDILVAIDGEKVGVSVVRAVGFPKDAPYTVEQATTILRRKLDDILVSSANVSAEHRWVKQILSVLAYADGHVASIQSAWEALPAATRADTIVIVTVTHGDDGFVY
jgi:hypothetical protein